MKNLRLIGAVVLAGVLGGPAFAEDRAIDPSKAYAGSRHNDSARFQRALWRTLLSDAPVEQTVQPAESAVAPLSARAPQNPRPALPSAAVNLAQTR